MKPRITDDWLAELWVSANSLPEACRLTGYRPSWLLRRLGVPLRRLPRRDQPEPLYDALNQFGEPCTAI